MTKQREKPRKDDARVVGLDQTRLTSIEQIERRRLELWLLTTGVVALIGAALIVTSWAEPSDFRLLSPGPLRGAIVVLALAFCAYAIEKEFALRKITRLLLDERLLTASLTDRLEELSNLLAAGQAMNSVLELEEVLDVILSSALDLLDADSGSIMLAEDKELRAVCVRGNPDATDARIQFGDGIAGRVADTRDPVLISGSTRPEHFPGARNRHKPVNSAMSVPLVNRNELLGVLNVNASAGRTFTEHDLRALSVFAEQATGAIANARLYKTEQEQVAQLLEIDRMKSEFITAVNHDLRTPLTLLLGSAQLARRPGLPEHERNDLLDTLQRQSRNLASMIDALLITADLDRRERPPLPVPVDVAKIAREVAGDFTTLGKTVDIEAPPSCTVLAEPASLQRVLSNLVANAYTHGAPPVRITVERRRERAIVSVIDSGPGVPPEHRERIFERFTRLDPSRTRPGIGLGLSIVRGLISDWGGSVSIEDGPEGGAAFRVSLATTPDAEPTIETAAEPDRTTHP